MAGERRPWRARTSTHARDLELPANGSGQTSRARRRRTHVPPPQRLSGESGFSLSDQCPPPGCCSVCPTHVRMRPHSRCKGPRPPPGCCSVWSGPNPLGCACRARRSTASSCGAGSCSPREATALLKRSSSVMRGAGPSVPRPLFPSWIDNRPSLRGGARWAAQALGARGSSAFPRSVRRRLPPSSCDRHRRQASTSARALRERIGHCC
jgi:hypothetical protein